MSLFDVLIVYLAFRVKQVACDFFFQTGWMVTTKGMPFKMGGARALAAHAGVHALATLGLMLIFAPDLWWLGVVDFAVHGAIDKLKIIITKKYGWTYKDNAFWWAFGIDQEAHNLTHLVFIILMVLHAG